MRVTLALHGGWGAAVHLSQQPRQLDTEDLPAAAAGELARLVTAARTVPAPSSQPLPDAMSYTVTIEDGGRRIVIKQSDATMSPEFADLLSWLQLHLTQA
jgi:hypothetical protein